MNPSPAASSLRPPANRGWVRVGLALALIPCVGLLVIAVGVASCFQLSSDTRALRNGLMEASDVQWRQQIGLNLGSVTLGAVRAGLSFVSLDSRARAAVQAVRGAEVGLYELARGMKTPDGPKMLAVADRVLRARGWERVVGVLDGDQLVGVYLPAKTISANRLNCRVLVCDGRQMVLISGTANVEPLWQCLREQGDLRAAVRSLAAR